MNKDTCLIGPMYFLKRIYFLPFFVCLVSTSAWAAVPPSVLDQVEQSKLWETPQWVRLLHYQSRWFGGYKSEADGREFFLAPNGKKNPKAELLAFLEGLFDPKAKEGDDSIQCRFPARTRWLSEQLSLRRHGMRWSRCPAFREFKERLAADALSLVFSSYYMGSASSAFGHTFLRVHRRPEPGSKKRAELLDEGINYAATVPLNENALVYGFSGIFGGYPGHFSSVPYYYKVREYSDYESRDLWEYGLNLTEAELELFQEHLWELGQTYFYYYFLDENCSYHVLTLLEAVRPSLDLTSGLSLFVAPSETVKAVVESPGLVQSIEFRPSLQSRLRARYAALSKPERSYVREAEGEKTLPPMPEGFSKESRARVLDTLLDEHAFQHKEDLLKKEGEQQSAAMEEKRALLLERAKIRGVDSEIYVPPREAEQPHIGHGVSRLGVGGGYHDRLKEYFTAEFRLAFHDFLDRGYGYPALTTMEAFKVRFRYFFNERRFALAEGRIFHIENLAPLSRWKSRPSWAVDVGARRVTDKNCDECTEGYFDGGVGLSLAFPNERKGGVYALLEASLTSSRRFTASPVRLGLGPRVGVILRPWEGLGFWAEGRYRYYAFQFEPQVFQVQAGLRWAFARDWALSFESAYDWSGLEGEARLQFYF